MFNYKMKIPKPIKIILLIILFGLVGFVIRQTIIQIIVNGFSFIVLVVDVIVLYLLYLPIRYLLKNKPEENKPNSSGKN